MNPRTNRLKYGLLSLPILVLGARWVWIVSVSATGWMSQLDHWVNIVGSVVGIEHAALCDETPSVQAEFWLSKVASVDQSNHDPMVAMGAAWMLDGPQYGFIRNHVGVRDDFDFTGFPAHMRLRLDEEAIRSLCDDFERLGREECLTKIESAIQLDQSNSELWRARALLLFRPRFLGSDYQSRQEDCLTVLDRCMAHDPDNALYDYLAALHLWTASATYEWKDDGLYLLIHDPEAFACANARLASGLNKPYLKSGTAGYAATLAFLDCTSLGAWNRLSAAGSRQIDGRVVDLVYQIMRWQEAQQDVARRNQDFRAAIETARAVLHISNQMTPAGNYPNLATPQLILRRTGVAGLLDLQQSHPELFDVGEGERLSSQLAAAEFDLKVLQEAGEHLAARAGNVDSVMLRKGLPMKGSEKILPALVMGASQILVIVTMGLAMISWLATCVGGSASDDRRVAMGWFRHTITWCVAFAVSVLVLGMFPAELVSSVVQTAFVCGLIWMGPGLIALSLLVIYRKYFPLTWTQVVVLLVIMVAPFIVILKFVAIRDSIIFCAAAWHPYVSVVLLLVGMVLLGMAICACASFLRTKIVVGRRKCLAAGILFVGVLVAIPSCIVVDGLVIDEINTQIWVAPKIGDGAQHMHLTVGEIQNGMDLGSAKWTWAFVQWLLHDGAFWTPLIAVAGLLLWYAIRRARRFAGGVCRMLRTEKRTHIRLSGNEAARSCLVCTLVFFLLYLAVAPTLVKTMETYCQVHRERMMDPARTWQEMADACDQIETFPAPVSPAAAEDHNALP